MELIEFPEHNAVYGAGQPQYKPAPAYREGFQDGRVIYCWGLTLRERLRVLWTGRIWQHTLTFNTPIQPVSLEVESPFRK